MLAPHLAGSLKHREVDVVVYVEPVPSTGILAARAASQIDLHAVADDVVGTHVGHLSDSVNESHSRSIHDVACLVDHDTT